MIRISEPFFNEEEKEIVTKVLESGNLVQGKYVKEFELGIKNILGSKYVFAVSSCTAALHLALVSLDIGAGDEVIVPNFSFTSTVNVVELVGAKPIFVDICLDDFCIDVDKIEEKITNKTKAIIPVHEFGHVANMEKILDIANKWNIKVVEDAACALGSKFKNRMIGTIGDIGAFSFHPRKSITTGEGGVIVTNSDEIAMKISSLRNHGITLIDEKVDFIVPGFNYRMTDIQGSMGLIQLDKLDNIQCIKNSLVKIYFDELDNLSNIILPKNKEYCTHTFQSFHIIVKNELRDSLKTYLKDNDIESNYGAYYISSLYYYKNKYNLSDVNFYNSKYAHENGLVLPLHPKLTKLDIIHICEKIKEFFKLNK